MAHGVNIHLLFVKHISENLFIFLSRLCKKTKKNSTYLNISVSAQVREP